VTLLVRLDRGAAAALVAVRLERRAFDRLAGLVGHDAFDAADASPVLGASGRRRGEQQQDDEGGESSSLAVRVETTHRGLLG